MAKCVFIFFYLCCFSFLLVTSLERCTQKANSPCVCEYSDGKIIDLTPLSGESFLTAITGNLTYYFHACTNQKPSLPKVNFTLNECDSTSMCLFNRTNNTAINLGKATDASFSLLESTGKYELLYRNKNLTTFVKIACTDYVDSVLYVTPNDENHDLVLFSKHACTRYENHGLSTGSVLVILLLVFTAVYLLGGAAILHLLRGARGREMVPNIDFWTELPLLVKDGAVFLQNGCKPPMISTSDSYDRI